MTPEKLWGRSGLSGTYEVWSFEESPDELSELVLQGIKTATCSVYDLYRINNEKIPQEGVSVSSERLCLQSETAIKAVFLWWIISSRRRADRYALGPPLHGTYIGFRIADRRVRSSRGSNEMFGVKNAEKWRVPALFAFGPTQKSTQKLFFTFVLI